MSISTRRGDDGETSSPGSGRVSKGELRVEASGNVDELNTAIGLARANCHDDEVAQELLSIQRELFKIGSAISTKPGGRRPMPEIDDAMVARLDAIVERIEATPDLIRDWTIPGGHPTSAPLELARAICRRAERNAVRLVSAGEDLQKNVLRYLNRLSDVLWLYARLLDLRHGIDSRLRDSEHPGPPW